METKFQLIDGDKYRRKVRAIIMNEQGEVLLIQPHDYRNGTWSLVGGGIEDGEAPLAAIKREMLEEVGISEAFSIQQSANPHRFKFSSSYKEKKNVDHDGQLADMFWVTVRQNIEIKIQHEEIKKFCWAPVALIGDFIKVPAQLKLFEKMVEEFYDQPIRKFVS